LTLIDNIAGSSKQPNKSETKTNKNAGPKKAVKSSCNKPSASLPIKPSDVSTSQSPPRITHSFKEQRHSQIRDGRPQPHGKTVNFIAQKG